MRNEEMKYNMNNPKMRKRNIQRMTEQRQGTARPLLILAFAFLISHFSFSICNAQTFTQSIQKSKAGEGKVTIHQDKSIDELVNAPVETPKPKQDNSNKATTPKPVTAKTTTANNEPAHPSDTTVANRLENDTLTTNTHRRSYKTTGYRVQAFAGGNTRRDRQRAEQAGRALRELFPGEDVYVHFYSPRWICRLGNYRTYDEAHSKMLEVRKMGYESATVVKGKITVYQ